ncbi:hypothetical protein PR048_011302 [Dryococelus australis]|uniref:Secreted protein n=1 Tax=Dryococelus australis TaxID=614101 RepID=A0ABQ9HL67_9NEOP|nr:hypothetical protein PR048_011302 [Dryococelus australis]
MNNTLQIRHYLHSLFLPSCLSVQSASTLLSTTNERLPTLLLVHLEDTSIIYVLPVFQEHMPQVATESLRRQWIRPV